MERIRLLFEQIEEAKRLMQSGTLPNIRLALILLDNAAELTMYRELRYRFSEDDYHARIRGNRSSSGAAHRFIPKYSDEERRAAEREFTSMVKILHLRLAMISAKDAVVLRVCHEIRRDAFHRGEMNPCIMLPVTQLLFLVVAGLATSFPVHTYSIPGGQLDKETTDFLTRFDVHAHGLGDKKAQDQIYQKLFEGIAFEAELRKILSRDLQERIDATIGGLSYLNDDSTDRAELDYNLRYTQFWREQGSEIVGRAFREGRAPKEDLDAAYRVWSDNPGPRFTMDKLERWRRQAVALANTKHPADALARYRGFEKLLAPLEEDISRAVARFDDEINMKVHDRHGLS